MQFMNRLYSTGVFYRLISDFIPCLGDVRRAKKSNRVSVDFRERIILAVTQVNGCKMCSLLHTKNALEGGMTADEISELLDGEFDGIPEEQGVAVMFAQHYADSAGCPSKQTYESMLEQYGAETTRDIMSFIRLMMVTNIHGNSIDALRHRLKGKPVQGSHFPHEILISLGFPFFLLAAAFRELHGKLIPSLRYQQKSFQ